MFMLPCTFSTTAMSWAWSGDSDIQPRWLQELQSQESLRQIDRATKYVHIRRGSKTWSTVLQQIQDSYKLNYVEVEIGPPKPGRDGAERGPFIKLSDGGSGVNYSTIIFPDRDQKSDGTENRNSVGNGTSKSNPKLERKNSKKLAKQLQKQKILQQQKQQEQELLQQFYTEPPVLDPQNRPDEPIGGSAPTSPVSRRRALSTPSINRKVPTEAELADAIKARKERKDHEPSTVVPPKTRTLPPREKPWLEDEMQGQEPIIMTKKDLSAPQGTKPIELSHAMRAMQMKVRRKSSVEGYPMEFSHSSEHPTTITKSSSFGPQDLNLTNPEPCAEILVDDMKQSKPPVLKKSKSELEKETNAFPPNQSPLQQTQQQMHTTPSLAWIDSPSFHQSEDEMYMNVAFSKPNKLPLPPQQSPGASSQVQNVGPPLPGHPSPGQSPGQSGGASSPGLEQPPLHRYENVFLEERVDRLSGTQDRPSSTDSRGSLEMNKPVPAPRYYGSNVDISTATSPGHVGSHPGHCRKESWGNAATFASHGISPTSHHRMSPKHDSPSGSPRTNELSSHLKNNTATNTVHNSHIGQTGRALSSEGVNLKPKNSPPVLGIRSSGSLDNHSNASNRGSGSAESSNRGNRGHRGSNASLGPDGSSVKMLRKMSQDRMPPSFAAQPWYYGKMLRQECEYLMLSQGKSCQYLVRDSSHRVGDLMLSVLYGTKVHHYVIQTTPEGKFQIAHHDFNSVEDILDFYHQHVIMYSPNQEPVYLRDAFVLDH
ncbi:uncharacterized protein [Amphiura filiformis]|uniref:uncharacterized protein n=1 Tax=Amphiura filiformis TaxID=82378 RepID=UPI003B2273B8